MGVEGSRRGGTHTEGFAWDGTHVEAATEEEREQSSAPLIPQSSGVLLGWHDLKLLPRRLRCALGPGSPWPLRDESPRAPALAS